MNRPVITLTTDFGTRDPYVGAMKGVILSRCPQANIVDISHEIKPQSIPQGAYVLASAATHFPPDAIHVAVVDPGVGSDRRSIAVHTPSGTFVGPDNGLISLAICEYIQTPAKPNDDIGATGDTWQVLKQTRLSEQCRGVVLDEPSFWLPNVSRTFHGRDVFAPVSAHIASGVQISDLGSPLESIGVLPHVSSDGANLSGGTVVHIDRYGNLITNIPADSVPVGSAFEVAGHRIEGLSSSYSEAVGKLLAIIGSEGTVEIAVGNGNAARTLNSTIGDRVAMLTESP